MKNTKAKRLERIQERLNSLHHMEYDVDVEKEIDKLLKENDKILTQIKSQNIYSVLRNNDSLFLIIVLIICLFSAVAFVATNVLIENTRSASETESVPSAESFLPLNGKDSGPR